jgi:cold shock protein
MSRIRGRVVWFTERQGFGFISRQGGPDLFFHRSQLVAHVSGTLEDGAEVEFDLNGPDARHAENVTALAR